MTNSIPEIRDADFLFVTGSNTTEAHPIIAMEMKRAVLRGAKLAVSDPRAIWLTEIADWHLQIKPGTDVWLLNAMANVIVTEGLEDSDFIARNTENWEAVRDTVLEFPPEAAEKVTGVSAQIIRDVARAYATTEKAGIYYTLGITEHTCGTDNVYALSNLVLMTGHLGKRSVGMNPLRGQNNVQGANDAGATPVFYPGYQRAEDPEVRRKFTEAWGVEQSTTPGLNLNEMMKAMSDGRIRGLYLMGEDIVVSEPNVCRVEEAMNELDFVVVQDIFFNESCRYADVVLPAACFAEKDGVFTNSDRRVQRVRKALEPPGQARADWEIILDVMRRVGFEQPDYRKPGRDLRRDGAVWHPNLPESRTRESRRRVGCSGRSKARTPRAPSICTKGGFLRGKGSVPAGGLFATVRAGRCRIPANTLDGTHLVPLQRRYTDSEIEWSDRKATGGLRGGSPWDRLQTRCRGWSTSRCCESSRPCSVPGHDQPPGQTQHDLDAISLPRFKDQLSDDRCRRQGHRHR